MKKLPVIAFILLFRINSFSQDKQIPDNYIKTELYFGMSKQNGGSVSKKEWKNFVEKEISGVFADGMTIFDGNGIWFDEKRKTKVNEKSKLVIAIHVNSEEFSKRINELREKYKKQFDQSIVMRTDEKVMVSFE